MSEALLAALNPTEHTTLLLDTNLLLLFVTGSIDRDFVEQFRRTRTFAREDFDTLTQFMARFAHLITTASVLTEVSNLADKIPPGDKSKRYLDVFREVTDVFKENFLPSRELSRVPEFARLGLTDAGIVQLSGRSIVVLTDDLPLYLALCANKVTAFNFNHVRTGAWGSF